MRINCHCHVFNLQSIFTNQILEVFLHQMIKLGLPHFLEEPLTKEIKILMKTAREYNDEEQLLRRIIERVNKKSEYQEMILRASKEQKRRLDQIGTNKPDNLSINGMMDYFKWLEEHIAIDRKSDQPPPIVDTIDFLRMALKPAFLQVSNSVFEKLSLTDDIILLLMDLVQDGIDKEAYERQIEEVSKMALAYPGRVLPFFALHPQYPDYFEIMEHALHSRGFVGIVLYASLGYTLNSPSMDKVYRYCEEREIPILMHGCHREIDEINGSKSNPIPDIWSVILHRYPKLKVCFGHLGGEENLVKEKIEINSWTLKILSLMKRYSNVYADVCFHDERGNLFEIETNFVKNFQSIMEHSLYRRRLLYGMDYFLIRRYLKDDQSFFRFFEEELDSTMTSQITEGNPIEYLGLRTKDRAPKINIKNYARFLYLQKDKIERAPSPWLVEEVKSLFGPSSEMLPPVLGSRWAWNNDVHFRVWSFMRQNMSSDQKSLPFEDTGRIKLRQLSYWDKEIAMKYAWRQKLNHMAKDMDLEFRSKQALYEKNVTEDNALDKLKQVFDCGEISLYQLAEVCDHIYQFDQK